MRTSQDQSRGGFAHLDLYFEDKTTEEMKNVFINFVENHLRQQDIEICENIETVIAIIKIEIIFLEFDIIHLLLIKCGLKSINN